MSTAMENALFTCALIALFVTLVSIGVVLGSWECHAKYGQSYEVEFGLVQGCMVKLEDGRWLPSETLRVMED